MSRYFLEVAYKGTRYAGFQKQQNAQTIQSEIEKAMHVFFRESIALTGSSRTDAGVHAYQNYFHFDFLALSPEAIRKNVYRINAILPTDIVIKNIKPVGDMSHSRFDAISRQYNYFIHDEKNPFSQEYSYFYPYRRDIDVLNQLAGRIQMEDSFESFCKKNTQVHTYKCYILESRWSLSENGLMYQVKANRFLRGMVKGLVGTMLRLSAKPAPELRLKEIFDNKNSQAADFSVPSHGLFLRRVEYPQTVFSTE